MHQPRMSFDSGVSTDQREYYYEYEPDSPHRSKSGRVSAAAGVDVNVNVNYKSPFSMSILPAIASSSSSTPASAFRFGGELMIYAQTGLLVGRPNLEEGCLTADGVGEDAGMSVSIGGFRTCFPFLSFFFFSNAYFGV